MDWNAVAAVGEATGAVAVIISVIYLALQVRENTRTSIHNMVQDAIKDFARVEEILATTPDLAAIVLRGNEGVENLSPDQRLRFGGYNAMFFSVLEVWHTQSRRLPVDPEQDETVRKMLDNRLAERGCLQWWHENQLEFPAGFRKWVAESIIRPDSSR